MIKVTQQRNKNMNKILISIIFFSISYSSCLDGYYLDDCGNCWAPYCYNSINEDKKFDMDENECMEKDFEWIMPNSDKHIYYNKYCDGSCPKNFLSDDCGNCWSGFCYSFFSKGLDGDPAHSVYYDLNEQECQNYGYNYYLPNNRFNPYWNSSCEVKDNDKKKYIYLLPAALIVILLAI